jgi:protein SCO1/2
MMARRSAEKKGTHLFSQMAEKGSMSSGGSKNRCVPFFLPRLANWLVRTLALLPLTLLTCIFLQDLPARAADTRPPMLRDVGVTQRLNEQVPLDLRFRDESGNEVRLGDYFGDKPVILTLVYYECPMLCTLVLNGLVSSLRALSFDVGEQFSIVTVSFDPKETPALAAEKKRTYLDEYRRPGAADGWHFLTGDAEAIAALTRAVGFEYRYDAERDEYAHAAAIEVLTPAGKIARYFYGVEYAPRDLRFALIEATEERIGSAVDELLLYCYHYDPSTGRYSAAVMNFVRLGGALTVIGIGAFVFFSGWGGRRKGGKGAAP